MLEEVESIYDEEEGGMDDSWNLDQTNQQPLHEPLPIVHAKENNASVIGEVMPSQQAILDHDITSKIAVAMESNLF